MFKNYYTIVLTLFTIFAHSQNISFQPNVNYQAIELEQILDEHKKLLVLKSKVKDIQQVDIFNEDFYKSINIDSTITNIDLNTLPIGNFVIQAKLDKKWIVMYLEKKEGLKTIASHQNINVRDNQSFVSIKNPFEFNNENTSFFYWVVSESNSSFGSNKIIRLEYKEDIDKLISKAKLELKTVVGKNNKLLVYEVYDK